jgi:branched-chain amino acid transport system substrate-binding protein
MVKSKTRRVTITGTALLLCLGLVTAGSSIVGAGAATKKVPGVTATQVTIGATEPLTGIASAGYDQIAPAMSAVFKWVNAHGGVNGRKIKFVVKDDCYGTPGSGCTSANPSTVAQTHALLGIPVFATVGSLGTPTQDSVRALLRGDDVPQTFVASGS